ncbi:hypothetical protein LUX57_15350 [Actinomadura madurae]|uniref:hypothetical protein n=1 Tax=Actinomadura madurae TaxID=1993 RepID=UPI0020D21D04|nr:hypothetical protein [Actinomadura madurae]MCP9966312.1 hypothetical protein [Actinomadura madurae]
MATIDTRHRWNAMTMIPNPMAAASTVRYGQAVAAICGLDACASSLHPLIASSAVPTGNPELSP